MQDEAVAERVQEALSNQYFRCYRTTDVVGVELGGALKNVLAIACGVSDGLGYGHNARAALITRGLQEITKLAVAKGAHPLTMAGLAGGAPGPGCVGCHSKIMRLVPALVLTDILV
jgi:glycerol-3-phosphate dehydrogenase (NAD(P)+)